MTKYRRFGVFDDEMLTRCEEIMRKVCEDFEAELKEFNGRPVRPRTVSSAVS